MQEWKEWEEMTAAETYEKYCESSIRLRQTILTINIACSEYSRVNYTITALNALLGFLYQNNYLDTDLAKEIGSEWLCSKGATQGKLHPKTEMLVDCHSTEIGEMLESLRNFIEDQTLLAFVPTGRGKR